MTETTKEQQKQIQSIVMEIVNSIKHQEQSKACCNILKVFNKHCFRITEVTLRMIDAILDNSEHWQQSDKEIQHKIRFAMIAVQRFKNPQIWVSVGSDLTHGFLTLEVRNNLVFHLHLCFVRFCFFKKPKTASLNLFVVCLTLINSL